MQLNIDQLKQDACRLLTLVSLIERSQDKAKQIACMPYFGVFGSDAERVQCVQKQNAVTQRLVDYLAKVCPYPFAKQGIYNVGGQRNEK